MKQIHRKQKRHKSSLSQKVHRGYMNWLVEKR